MISAHLVVFVITIYFRESKYCTDLQQIAQIHHKNHMGLFDFLGPAGPVTVATFELGDSTDLQIRSLLYLFKRLRINKLAPFPNGTTLKYADGKYFDGVPDAHVQKLDGLYNLAKFQKLLVSEEHRVLIDYPKNKFRAFCILSEYPSSNFSRPLSPVKGNSTDEIENGFPVLKDYMERRVKNFSFSLLAPGKVTVRDLALELANSLLYVEHHSYVPFSARLQAAREAITKTTGVASDDGVISLKEESKTAIVGEYLRGLAFLVQLVRLYDEYTKQHSEPVSPTKLRSVKSFSQMPQLSPTKPSLSPLKTSARPLSRNLSSKPSISNFKATEIYNPVTSPQKTPMSGSTLAGSVSHEFAILGKEIRPELWEKCKLSIKDKLAREAKRT